VVQRKGKIINSDFPKPQDKNTAFSFFFFFFFFLFVIQILELVTSNLSQVKFYSNILNYITANFFRVTDLCSTFPL